MFDLHLHSKFSDGSLTLDNADKYLKGHYEYRTVTDHNSVEFHRNFNGLCSSTGMEIFSYYDFEDDREFAELLIFGFNVESELIKNLEQYLKLSFPLLNIRRLSQYLQPLRDEGVLLFLAHPSGTYRINSKRETVLKNIIPYVDGFECLHSCFNKQDAIWILEFCKENKKLATGGSDSHNVPLFETPHLDLLLKYEDLFSWIPEMANKC